MNDSQRLQYLRALGIEPWVLRGGRTQTDSPALQEPFSAPPLPLKNAEQTLDWDALAREVSVCTRCRLHEQRTHAVFGAGVKNADLLVLGEAPGAEEDRRGEAFVGRAGKLLDAMLGAIGRDRAHSVFITNIVKCRPPGNRDPAADEAAACHDYLRRQMAMLKPRAILAVGRVAAQNLLSTEEAVGRMRGKVHRYGDDNIPVVVSYHPAYLLRSPIQKRKAWDDLKRLRQLLEEES